MNLWKEYRENAGSPELVMLHGWGMSSKVWGGFADALSEYFSLTLIDLPGLGHSAEFPDPYTTESVVNILKDNVPDQAVWLGWSMGGQIAIAFADSFPERVSKLITIASNPCFVKRENWPTAMDEATHAQFEQSLANNVKKTLSRFCMLQTQGADQSKETLKMLKGILAETTHSAANESLSPLREDIRPLLSTLTLPILQLFGEKDLLVPVAASSACERLTGQKAITYSGAGHLPFYSHQDKLLDDLLGFCGVRG
ncbi:MAG: alpha/beta fold hydrolase [Neptuniibacter sp.]